MIAEGPYAGAMAEYTAPLRDIRFVLEHLVDLESITELPGFEHVDADGVYSVLEENARFMEDLDRAAQPRRRRAGQRPQRRRLGHHARGLRGAYQAYVDAGWNGVAFPPEYGGGGFPWLVGIAMQEILTSANMAFSMCPLLNQGAIDMLLHHASEEHKETYLPKMVTGEWTGTMNLTEPQAGSDVGALTTKAVPQDDGTYRITGTKIFISFGEHDMSQNIVHLVLARTPSAPPGTKGISCFIVPKHLLNDDGTPGERNDVTCVSIEHKMGIKASPTCVLSYGDAGEGAVGYLIGEENAGMRYMFTMMNNARLSVGLEGLSLAERAFQMALAYAKERRQGRAPGAPAGEQSLIIEHPDVRRMLLTQKACIEALRGIIYANAAAMDRAARHPDEAVRTALRRAGRHPHAGVEGLGHRPRRGAHEPRAPGVRRHGLHRGDRHRPALPRRSHRTDLRGHQRHPGHGPRRPQAPDARRAAPSATTSARSRPPSTRSATAGDDLASIHAAPGRRARRRSAPPPTGSSPTAWPTRSTRWPAPRRTCGCSASSPAAGSWPCRRRRPRRLLADAAPADKDFYEGKVLTARFFCEQVLPQARGLLPAVTATNRDLAAAVL